MSRVLFVHAHPDDETLATGIALAHLRDRGHDVHVLTCTLGEEGEVIPPGLSHLEQAPGDPLAAHRRAELRTAMGLLGVSHHVLGEPDAGGEPAAYRDSGMAGSVAARHTRAFASAPLATVAGHLRAVIAGLAPDLVVTYDGEGGYGHPDHIRVHEATVAALAGMPEATRPRLALILTPLTWAREDRAWLTGADLDPAWSVPGEDAAYPPSVVADALVTYAVCAPEQIPRQAAALRAHATQVIVGEGAYALSNLVAARLSGREGYAAADPVTGALLPGHGPRRDLGELLRTGE